MSHSSWRTSGGGGGVGSEAKEMMSLFTSSVLNSEPVEGGTNSVVVGQVLHWPHGSNSGTSVIDVFVAGVPDQLRVHGVNSRLQFVLRHSSAVAEHLSADVLAGWRGSVQLQQHVGLQQVLGTVNLKVGDVVAEP